MLVVPFSHLDNASIQELTLLVGKSSDGISDLRVWLDWSRECHIFTRIGISNG